LHVLFPLAPEFLNTFPRVRTRRGKRRVIRLRVKRWWLPVLRERRLRALELQALVLPV
jgi:hypothetical protein